MAGLLSLRSLFALVAVGVALSACGGDDPSTSGTGDATVDPIVKEIPAAAGGTISDPDGDVFLAFPAGSLGEDTEITLTITPKTPETATEVYAFTPAGLQLSTPASLTISTIGVTVPAGKKAVLAAYADGGWGALPGSMEGSGGLQAQISTLGTFSVILSDAPAAGACDATCMGQSGAVCCEACGCMGAVQCMPVCPAATPWDCEIGCCFDYDLLECAP